MSDRRTPFYERHPWTTVAAVLALIGSAWAFIGAPTPWKIASDVISPELPASNTMLVFDASSAMEDRFGKRTKLQAAQRAVERFTIPIKNEGLALRAFGGSCSESGQILVDFGAEHGDDVRDKSAKQRPHGRSNLVNAVRAAIDDFADNGHFPDGGPRRIVVFAGSVDECAGSGGAREIRDDIEHSGVDATFKFVGFKLGKRSRKKLIGFGKALGQRAEVAFVTTEPQLTAVDDWLAKKPNDVTECTDKVDNDGDSRVDDDDSECASGDTEASSPGQGNCEDGIDNDNDGKKDDLDSDCVSGTTEVTPPAQGNCDDGIDNDDDGQKDGEDSDCVSGETEVTPPAQGDCADGIDNDDDGEKDGEDPDCSSGDTEASVAPIGNCADGIDNDEDGKKDGEDPGCAESTTEASK